jgi:hypothetical protein
MLFVHENPIGPNRPPKSPPQHTTDSVLPASMRKVPNASEEENNPEQSNKSRSTAPPCYNHNVIHVNVYNSTSPDAEIFFENLEDHVSSPESQAQIRNQKETRSPWTFLNLDAEVSNDRLTPSMLEPPLRSPLRGVRPEKSE